jgi:hypothetical protein
MKDHPGIKASGTAGKTLSMDRVDATVETTVWISRPLLCLQCLTSCGCGCGQKDLDCRHSRPPPPEGQALLADGESPGCWASR